MIHSFGSGFNTNLNYGAVGALFGANEHRMGLLNSVTGAETPEALTAIQSQDKADALQSVQAQVNYKISEAMQAGQDEAKRKREDRVQRQLAGGQLFVLG